MYLSDGSVLATFFDENRQYVTLDQISPRCRPLRSPLRTTGSTSMAQSTFSPWYAQLGNAAGGGISGGGSTLTQQYVKQVRLQMCNGDTACVEDAQAPA